MNLTLQHEPNAKPENYPDFLLDMCLHRTRMINDEVAQWLEGVQDFLVQNRYAFNSVRVWYCPKVLSSGLKIFGSRIKRPMAEDTTPKDKWYAGSGVMAYTFPLTEEATNEPIALFGPGSVLEERYDDEEVQGGKIALIAVKQMRAQKPPNGLDRMQSTFSKQVAYNQRILEAESQIAGINCGIPHFLEDMTLEEPVYVCINSSEEMDRNEQSIAGQLWIQGDRHMSASNVVPDGMADTKESAALAAAAEAVSWNHASQPDQPRKGQRVIIYPRDLLQLEEFLSSGDPNVDPEDGHPLAYATILQESAKFETTPLFLNEDSEPVTSDPFLSEKVPEWMAQTKQVATGCRRRTLENGPDVENSDDEEDPNMQPDKCEGAYTAEMDPKKGPKVLTPKEVAYQRAVGSALTASKTLVADSTMAVFSDSLFPPVPFSPESVHLVSSMGREGSSSQLPKADSERMPTPLGTPVNSDEEDLSWDQRRGANLGKKMAGKKKPPYAERIPDPVIQAPAKGAPLESKKAIAVPAVGILKERTKAAASPRVPADQPKEAKASTRKKGQIKTQESPETQVSPPMATRARTKQQEGSRAGGFRPGVGGSGQTDTCVASSNPSKT
jgi:hypothetical protein